KVEVAMQTRPQETVDRATLVDGLLRTIRITRAATTYAIKGAQDAPRTVIVEHPQQQGWRFFSSALESSTPTHHRLRAAVEAGGEAEIEAIHERTETDSIALVDADEETLLYWSGQLDDTEVVAVLAELAERRRALARAESEVREI